MENRVKVNHKNKELNEIFFVFALLLIFSPFVSFTQDRIYRTDGTIIETKVQEVGVTEIRYKKFSNQNGPAYIINKNEVKMIVYENGDKEVYQSDQQPVGTTEGDPVTGRPDGNTDLIITLQKENIRCVIDKVDHETISYHIRKRGVDPKKEIGISGILKYSRNGKWYDANGIGNSADEARNFILREKISTAISAYSRLIAQDSLNAALYAEDAYALALGGIYEAALNRLDRSRTIGVNSPDINYFTAQVFSLMGYDDLANAFWTSSSQYDAPAWIASKSAELLKKFKNKSTKPPKVTREQLISSFKRANMLAAQRSYVQSIALFQRITDLIPNEYLPYVGYSITLEKTGALEKSARLIEKAITITGNSQEDLQKKQFLQERLASLKVKIAAAPQDELPGFSPKKVPDRMRPQMMIYAGGMAGPSMINITGRFGTYTSGSSNTSADFSYTNNAGFRYMNIGVTGYVRLRSLVSGVGFGLTAGDVKTAFSLKLSIGLSKINITQTSSFDVFLDINAGLTKGSMVTYGLSLGKTLYFGKRK